jgi:hypothetical protein
MLHHLLLSVHVGAGTAGLVLGPLAMAARNRWGRHTRLGLAYQAAVALMTSTALALVALAPARLWWLAPVALATEAAAVAGWMVRRRHAAGWLPRHVRLMAGSYVSFVTAALVVNWSSPLAWILPTLIGTPLIEVAAKRAAQVRAPAGAVPARLPA